MEGSQLVLAHMWHEGLGYLLVLVTVIGLFLLRVREERRTLYNTLAFFLFSIAGLFVSGLVHVSGFVEQADEANPPRSNRSCRSARRYGR